MRFAAAEMDVRPMSRLLKALADETRLRVVALLAHGELCVCHVEQALGLSQPNISRHLSILRAAAVVEPRRDGNWVYYRLAPQLDAECGRLLRALTAGYAKRALLARDVERLLKVKGPGSCK